MKNYLKLKKIKLLKEQELSKFTGGVVNREFCDMSCKKGCTAGRKADGDSHPHRVITKLNN